MSKKKIFEIISFSIMIIVVILACFTTVPAGEPNIDFPTVDINCTNTTDSTSYDTIIFSPEYITDAHMSTTSYNCSSFVRRYLFDKYNNKCQVCGWGEINSFTNRVPLQIHHIDGDSCNNKEENLQLLCPNCHSLTENFGSRNNNASIGRSVYYRKAKAD